MLKATPPTKKKRLGWVQDWVGDWFWEALPAVGKLPMCRRSQGCSRISLHRTFLVPLRLLLSANPSRYRDSCCTTIQLLQLQPTKANYYYYNNNIQIQLQLLQHTNPTSTTTTYNSKSFPWHTWSGPFLFCVASKKSIQLVLPSQGPERILKGHTKSQHTTTCHMCWICTSLVKIWIWKWSEFSFFK
jgi:hypothetical protein